MKDLSLIEIESVSGGEAGEYEYTANWLLEDLEDGLSRLTMLVVLQGDLSVLEASLLELEAA